VLGEEFFADAGFAVEAVERGLRRNANKVAVAFFILGQHQQMVVVIAFARGAMILVFRDVELATEDRLDAVFLSSVEEVDRAIDVAVISHGDGLLPDSRHAFNEFCDVTCSVQQGILGMQMQMGKFGHD